MARTHAHDNSPGTQLIDAAAKQYNDMPSLTLARKLYNENPGVWPNVDAVRMALRRRYGAAGEKRRHCATVPREKRMAGEEWRQYLPPASLSISKPWGPEVVSGACRALILSDIHYPFYSKPSFEMSIEYGLERGADVIVLNGDTFDHHQLSRWQPDPRQHDFAAEVEGGVQLLDTIRAAFPDARIYLKLGNHEERYERYMMVHSLPLIGVKAFQWENVFELERNNIRLVTEKRPIQLGKLHVIHGHEFATAFSNPVNPARGFFLKAGTHVLGGHYHQVSQHSANNLEQNVVSAWSTGCLCELNPLYRPLNQWAHGFAFVTVDERGAFMVENKRIIDGRVW